MFGLLAALIMVVSLENIHPTTPPFSTPFPVGGSVLYEVNAGGFVTNIISSGDLVASNPAAKVHLRGDGTFTAADLLAFAPLAVQVDNIEFGLDATVVKFTDFAALVTVLPDPGNNIPRPGPVVYDLKPDGKVKSFHFRSDLDSGNHFTALYKPADLTEATLLATYCAVDGCSKVTHIRRGTE